MKIRGIQKDEHGFADYSYIPLVLIAPKLAGFEDNKQAATICKAFSAGVLSLSLLTDAKWGLIKLIPYKVHAGLDMATGLLAFAVAATPDVWKDKPARNTFIAMGIIGIVVGALSLVGAKKKYLA